MKPFWDGLSRSARVSLVLGVLAIACALAGTSWWALKPDYQVLVSDLKPQDAQVIATELEKLKVPYRMDDSGSAILVDKPQVLTTRMKVLGKDLPLHGTVGFEVFNNSDFGMTEFAQKINYQRALQGELTRTILSLAEISDARVLLAFPEQGLFKQSTAKPKASITLTLRSGKVFSPQQVSGIQRLVASATPGLTPEDVTVVDKQGIALSRVVEDGTPGAASPGAGGNARLELKKETEAQLLRKATAVLDSAFGAGQASASVDVTLNMDQVRTTTEDVLPAPSSAGDSKGVLVKERESLRESSLPPLDAARAAAGPGGNTQREAEYQVGRRVEQVINAAGAVRRIQVVAVVRQALDAAQEEQIRRLLAAAVGASIDKGDVIVVQSMRGLALSSQPVAGDGVQAKDATPLAGLPPANAAAVWRPATALIAEFMVGVLVAGLLVLLVWTRRHRQPNSPQPVLTARDRQQLLEKVQLWMHQNAAPDTSSAGKPSRAGGPL